MAPPKHSKKQASNASTDHDEEVDYGDGSDESACPGNSQADPGSARDFSVPPPSPRLPASTAGIISDAPPTTSPDDAPAVDAIPPSSDRSMLNQTSASYTQMLRSRSSSSNSTGASSPSSPELVASPSPKNGEKGKGKQREIDPSPPSSTFPPNCPLIPPGYTETASNSTRRMDNNALTLFNRSIHLERQLQELCIPSAELHRNLSSIATSLDAVGRLVNALTPHIPLMVSLCERLAASPLDPSPLTGQSTNAGVSIPRSQSPRQREGDRNRSTSPGNCRGENTRLSPPRAHTRMNGSKRSRAPDNSLQLLPPIPSSSHSRSLSPRPRQSQESVRKDKSTKRGNTSDGPSRPSKKARLMQLRVGAAPPVASLSLSSAMSLLPPPIPLRDTLTDYGTFYAFVGGANWSPDRVQARSQLRAIMSYLDKSSPKPVEPDVVERFDPEPCLLRLTFSLTTEADRFVTYFNHASRARLPDGYKNLHARRRA
ncbi:hypothetical protein VKT23_009667 [Stygiomarasmius scandens]|uniref:Uncharacterized protein n=1 Tax=Marasmiellus scandens TaxID=2682957 RepID=A0ABR1JIX1_9AGAR